MLKVYGISVLLVLNAYGVNSFWFLTDNTIIGIMFYWNTDFGGSFPSRVKTPDFLMNLRMVTI